MNTIPGPPTGFGAYFKMKRKASGLTLQEVADRLDYYDIRSATRLQSLTINPPLSLLIRIAGIFNMSVSDMLGEWEAYQCQSQP